MIAFAHAGGTSRTADTPASLLRRRPRGRCGPAGDPHPGEGRALASSTGDGDRTGAGGAQG
eukprot:9491088-Pyramimonas_sp.AAC.2